MAVVKNHFSCQNIFRFEEFEYFQSCKATILEVHSNFVCYFDRNIYGDQARYFDMEVKPKIRHNKKGLISFANNGNNQHGSQVSMCKLCSRQCVMWLLSHLQIYANQHIPYHIME